MNSFIIFISSYRCYKTHLWYPDCPKGAKYVVVYRDPCASFYSYFNFHKGRVFQPGEVSLHDHVKDFLLTREARKGKDFGSYFLHLLSWWQHRNDPNVLFLFFEDMKDDLESVVRKVAAFMGIENEEAIKKAVENSTFEFMKKNEKKFSDSRVARYHKNPKKFNLVVTGSAGKGREIMDDKTKEIIQAKWLEVVGKQTGFQNYNELRNAFRKERMDNI